MGIQDWTRDNKALAVVIAIIAVVLVSQYTNFDLFGVFGAVTPTGDCITEAVIINGKHIQTYANFRVISGSSFTDSEFETSGLELRSDGLYTLTCQGGLE